MLYNKSKCRKVNDKKVLHKSHKQWLVISTAILGMLGAAGAATTATTHADSVNNNANQNTQTNRTVNASSVVQSTHNTQNATPQSSATVQQSSAAPQSAAPQQQSQQVTNPINNRPVSASPAANPLQSANNNANGMSQSEGNTSAVNNANRINSVQSNSVNSHNAINSNVNAKFGPVAQANNQTKSGDTDNKVSAKTHVAPSGQNSNSTSGSAGKSVTNAPSEGQSGSGSAKAISGGFNGLFKQTSKSPGAINLNKNFKVSAGSSAASAINVRNAFIGSKNGSGSNSSKNFNANSQSNSGKSVQEQNFNFKLNAQNNGNDITQDNGVPSVDGQEVAAVPNINGASDNSDAKKNAVDSVDTNTGAAVETTGNGQNNNDSKKDPYESDPYNPVVTFGFVNTDNADSPVGKDIKVQAHAGDQFTVSNDGHISINGKKINTPNPDGYTVNPKASKDTYTSGQYTVTPRLYNNGVWDHEDYTVGLKPIKPVPASMGVVTPNTEGSTDGTANATVSSATSEVGNATFGDDGGGANNNNVTPGGTDVNNNDHEDGGNGNNGYNYGYNNHDDSAFAAMINNEDRDAQGALNRMQNSGNNAENSMASAAASNASASAAAVSLAESGKTTTQIQSMNDSAHVQSLKNEVSEQSAESSMHAADQQSLSDFLNQTNSERANINSVGANAQSALNQLSNLNGSEYDEAASSMQQAESKYLSQLANADSPAQWQAITHDYQANLNAIVSQQQGQNGGNRQNETNSAANKINDDTTDINNLLDNDNGLTASQKDQLRSEFASDAANASNAAKNNADNQANLNSLINSMDDDVNNAKSVASSDGTINSNSAQNSNAASASNNANDINAKRNNTINSINANPNLTPAQRASMDNAVNNAANNALNGGNNPFGNNAANNANNGVNIPGITPNVPGANYVNGFGYNPLASGYGGYNFGYNPFGYGLIHYDANEWNSEANLVNNYNNAFQHGYTMSQLGNLNNAAFNDGITDASNGLEAFPNITRFEPYRDGYHAYGTGFRDGELDKAAANLNKYGALYQNAYRAAYNAGRRYRGTKGFGESFNGGYAHSRKHIMADGSLAGHSKEFVAGYIQGMNDRLRNHPDYVLLNKSVAIHTSPIFTRGNVIEGFYGGNRRTSNSFIVNGIAVDPAGNVRYHVVGHGIAGYHNATSLNGWITANHAYTRDLYYRDNGVSNHSNVVRALKTIDLHTRKSDWHQDRPVGRIKAGHKITIKGIAKVGDITRFYVGHGMYISSDKKFVQWLR